DDEDLVDARRQGPKLQPDRLRRRQHPREESQVADDLRRGVALEVRRGHPPEVSLRQFRVEVAALLADRLLQVQHARLRRPGGTRCEAAPATERQRKRSGAAGGATPGAEGMASILTAPRPPSQAPAANTPATRPSVDEAARFVASQNDEAGRFVYGNAGAARRSLKNNVPRREPGNEGGFSVLCLFVSIRGSSAPARHSSSPPGAAARLPPPPPRP